MVRLLGAVASTCLLASSVLAQSSSNIPSCGAGQNCPQSLPCCSQYGQCGVGAYCLGGCDPMFSHTLNSCVPNPICKSQDYKFSASSLDGITPNTQYLGDDSSSSWVASGNPKPYKDGDQEVVLLTMGQGTVGTLLASTAYVWYGKVTARLKTSRTAGVVTAFILLSDVKDEIDFEFVGTDLNDAQSNYYFQGIPNYNNEKNITVTDTFGTYHDYEIDWTPDSITWSIDGKSYRTQDRSTTFNTTTNQYDFPQTPARIQLSLWPAGLSTNGKGTVDWAGGLIDWNSPDVKNAGYFYAMIADVNVQCYDPPKGATVSGSKAYVYTASSGTNDTVSTTNDNTILKSNLGTGVNMSADYPSASGSAGAPAASSDIPTVPGLTGVGTGSNGLRGGGDSGTPASTSGGSGSNPNNAPQPSSTGMIGGFTQGGPSSGTNAQPSGEKVLHGSMLAVLVAIVGMLAL